MTLFLLPALVGVTIFTAAFGVWRLSRGEDRLSERLKKIRGSRELAEVVAEEALFGGRLPLWVRPLMLLSWFLPGHNHSELLRWELAGAGYRHRDATKVFAGLRVVLTAAAGLGALYLTSAVFQLSRNEVFLVTAVGSALGFMAPWMGLRLLQNKRRQEITLALPDALDLLVICVEAGQGLNAALLNVSREASIHSRAVAEELRLVNLEMSTGVSRTQALRNLALRTGIDDVRALVAVLIQSDRFGTSVTQALRTHSKSLRTRRRQRAEEAARKTPVKMVFPLVFCIFPALLVVILAPGLMELVKALSGMV